MGYLADRVKDGTTTTGTGAVTLSGTPPAGFQSFASAFGSGTTQVYYCIADQGGPNWEVGRGTFNGATTLGRTTVLSSSNSGALVSFGVGTKDVFVTAPAAILPSYVSPVPLLRPYGASPASGGTVGDTPVTVFRKSGGAQSVFWSIPVTSAINLSLPIAMRLMYTSTVASGNFFMQIGYQVVAAGAFSAPSYTNLTESVAAPATGGDMVSHLTTSLVIPSSALVAQGWINLVLTRLATNVADTNTGDLQLVNVSMEQ